MPSERASTVWLNVILVNTLLIVVAVFLLVLSAYPGGRDGYLLPTWSRILLGVFASVLGVSLLADLIYKATFGRADAQERREEISRIIQTAFDTHYSMENRYGLIEFQKEMDFAKLFDSLNAGDELWWHDTFSPTLSAWIDNLRGALNRGVQIQMLVQDPSCQNARHRMTEITGFFTGSNNYVDELKRFRKIVIDLAQTYRPGSTTGHLTVREYDDLPSMPMYLVCRHGKAIRGYTSFFLTEPTGNKFPHLVWAPSESNLLSFFVQYLNDKWARAKPLEPPTPL